MYTSAIPKTAFLKNVERPGWGPDRGRPRNLGGVQTLGSQGIWMGFRPWDAKEFGTPLGTHAEIKL